MRKTILTLLFLSSVLNADYLLITKEYNSDKTVFTFSRCITDFYFNSSYLHYTKASSGRTYVRDLSNIIDYEIIAGYLYKDGYCKMYHKSLEDPNLIEVSSLQSSNLSLLGLKDSELYFLFGLSGILISSLFLFGLFRYI